MSRPKRKAPSPASEAARHDKDCGARVAPGPCTCGLLRLEATARVVALLRSLDRQWTPAMRRGKSELVVVDVDVVADARRLADALEGP